MVKDKGILTFIWFVTIVLLYKYVPRRQVRHGVLAFLYMQLVSWLFGILVVEKGLIKYPVREFKKAYNGSFSFEYFFFPALSALFNIYYPEEKNKLMKFLYIASYTAFVVINEVILEKYTNLIKYINWKWYWSLLSVGLSYYSSRIFYRWFFKEKITL